MVEIAKRKVGRPAINAVPVTVRIPPALLALLDAEIAKLDPAPSRPEFIRAVLEERLRRRSQDG